MVSLTRSTSKPPETFSIAYPLLLYIAVPKWLGVWLWRDHTSCVCVYHLSLFTFPLSPSFLCMVINSDVGQVASSGCYLISNQIALISSVTDCHLAATLCPLAAPRVDKVSYAEARAWQHSWPMVDCKQYPAVNQRPFPYHKLSFGIWLDNICLQ